MRILLQRVRSGRVLIDTRAIAEIAEGLVLLVGIGAQDGEEQVRYLADKVAHLRIFEDAEGKMNRSILETGGAALVVSQFTLYANTHKGRRPSFVEAAAPEIASPLVEQFAAFLREAGIPT
ncbi:MAG: D-aminoacyl-tRNA deacylase, partial [Anaerolineales bacterium]